MTLAEGKVGERYQVTSIATADEELEGFLLTLGCYPGEAIGLVSARGSNITLSIRDGRYTVDKNLAEAIQVESQPV